MMSLESTDPLAAWRAGYGPIEHRPGTMAEVQRLVEELVAAGRCTAREAWSLLAAADRLACAAMNVVAHMSYARRIDLSGAPG